MPCTRMPRWASGRAIRPVPMPSSRAVPSMASRQGNRQPGRPAQGSNMSAVDVVVALRNMLAEVVLGHEMHSVKLVSARPRLYMPMVPEAVDGHAGVRADRSDPFRRLRRLRRERAGEPHRARQAEDRHHGVMRDRGRAHRRIQAAPRRRDRGGRFTSRNAASSCNGRC